MKWGRTVLTAAFVCAFAAAAVGEDKKPPVGNAGQLARGKYLVEKVGMCADCHSPRNQKGEFVKEQWLNGSPLFFKATVPIPNWTEFAPGIAGLPGWNEKDAIQLLSTGRSMNGRTLNPPMPEVRLSQSDAAAVVAYLKSLKPGETATKSATKSVRKSGRQRE